MKNKIALVQNPPAYLDKEKTIALVVTYIEEAAKEGASLVVFPEAYISGYPTWVWRLRPGGDMGLAGEIHARMVKSAVDLSSSDMQPIFDIAKKYEVTVVIGMNEVDTEYSGSTIFNTVVTIGPEGTILNRHRKLMPTNPERMVWGMGDASGLRVVDTPVGRIGTLICWENYMPLARYALYAQKLDILVAPTWDVGEVWQASMRHIAREGGCWVLTTATALESSDMPDNFPERETVFPKDEWINGGGAMVVNPSGSVVEGPLMEKKEILYAEVDTDASQRARRSLDVAGHYARPDIFSLEVNREKSKPIDLD
ncbi:MAG: carbon-nitrogen hydrolase family protein [Candidatus Paceibacterota bacterium]